MIPSAPIWWDVPWPLLPRFPGGTVRADVAVIGAGLTGLSAAWHLLVREPSLRVVVLEAGRLGSGASGRTTGMLSPGIGQSLAKLVRRFGMEGARTLYLASLQAVEDARRLIADEAIACDLHIAGQLIVARGPAGRARLAAQADLLERLRLPGARLDDAALATVLRLAPEPRTGRTGPAALRLPAAGTLHPGKLLAGLAGRIVARGGTLFEEARVLSVGWERPIRLVLEGGDVLADQVVVATAGFTPALGFLRGRILPVHLQVVVTEPLDPDARRRLGWRGREGVIDSRRVFSYFRLTEDDRIVLGGGRPRYRWGGRADDGSGARAALDEAAAELRRTFPADVPLRVAGGWTGVIDCTVDGLPAIHRLPDWPGVLHAGGWCGHGVALALASGAWVTRLLLDGSDDLPWRRRLPPRVPCELLRWLAFHGRVAAMGQLDRRA